MTRASTRVRVLLDAQAIALATVADRPLTRIIGLLGRRQLAPGEGLLITPCRSIHTWFMRFAIDVVFLDESHRVVRVVERLTPFGHASGGPHARTVLELPAGTLQGSPVLVGQRLSFPPTTTSPQPLP